MTNPGHRSRKIGEPAPDVIGDRAGRCFRRGALWLILAGAAVNVTSCPGKPVTAPPRGAAARQTGQWQSVGLSGGGTMTTPAISPADPTWMIVNCDMSGAYQSYDGGVTWQMVHYRQLAGSTRVAPVFHPTNPKVAFALSGWSGGMRKTTDKGKTWIEVPKAPVDITAIAIDPGHPETMLLGVDQQGVVRSEDGGETWVAGTGLKGPVVGLHIDQTSPTSARTCFAATDRSIYRSDDGGATWTDTGAKFNNTPILYFTGGSNRTTKECVLYCSVRSRDVDHQIVGGLFRSDDRGANWKRAMGEGIDVMMEGWEQYPPRPAQYEFLLTTNANPSRVYASRGWGGRVFRSDNRGATWRGILLQHMRDPAFNVAPDYLIDERGGGGDTISGFAINPADPDHVIVTDDMSCFITRDGGTSWAVGHTRSAEAPGRRGPGMRWVNTGLVVTTVWHYYIDPFEKNRHYIAYTDIGYARSEDAGRTWYWQQNSEPLRNTTYELAFDPETPGKIWGAFSDLHDIPNDNVISGRHYWSGAEGGVGISGDFGVTWKDTSQGLPGKPIISVVVDPKSPKENRTLYASAWENGVYKSTDDGKTWVKRSDGLGDPAVNMRVCRLVLHPDGTLFCLITALLQDDVFVPQGVGLYRSKDGAETWERIAGGGRFLWPKDFDVDPRDSNVIYLGATDPYGPAVGGLYKTTDGGATWELIARKGPETFGATINPCKPDWVYLCLTESAPDCGLWLSRDAGKTWEPLEGLPFKNVQRVTFDPDDDAVIYVSTFGGSVWKGPAE